VDASTIFANRIVSRYSLAVKQHRNATFNKTANKSKNRDLFVQTCRKMQIEKVYASRFKRKFIAYLSIGFAVLSAHTMCAEVNEHRYACISIKGKYDERKTGHVAAVFRTCRAHNASDRSLSMWRRKRRPRNAIISFLISSRSIHNFRSLYFDDIAHLSRAFLCHETCYFCGIRKMFRRFIGYIKGN